MKINFAVFRPDALSAGGSAQFIYALSFWLLQSGNSIREKYSDAIPG
jgi:hypothetical protein